MVLFDPTLLQQESGCGKLRFPMYHLMYRFVPAVSGFRWQSVDSAMAKKLNRDNHLRHSLVFSRSPWKVAVERVKGIEPSYAAWEAAVLPLNYTRGPGRSVTRRRIWLLALAFAATLGCGACASLPPPADKPASTAFSSPGSTELGALVQASAPRSRASGFRLLVSGEDAFGSLVALADRTQRSLDLQYYLIANDASTRTILEHVRAAAQRGVRVRILLDDLNTSGSDASLLCFSAHPNIELRLYNPFPAGRFSTLTRVIASLTDMRRINQRMHDKSFVADNAIAITGGRNLGDAYFVQSPTSNFVDLDVIAAGPVVRSLSASFDRFWNSPLAYPIRTLVKDSPECVGMFPAAPEITVPDAATPDAATPDAVAPGDAPAAGSAATATGTATGMAPRATTSAATDAMPGASPDATAPRPGGAPAQPTFLPVPPSELANELQAGRLKLRWAPARVLADSPSKISGDGPAGQEEAIHDDLVSLMRSARREVIVVSPYFVPGERGVDLVRELRARGVRVRVLTNSLASTDAPVVHIGYARYRKPLLAAGTELYELRIEPEAPRTRRMHFGSSRTSLHAKALVIDRETVLVGSMNMDPRSANLNTELGLVIRSPAIAGQVVDLFEEVTEEDAYRVALSPGGRLRWITGDSAAPSSDETEPGASLGLRMMLWLLSPFAPDELL